VKAPTAVKRVKVDAVPKSGAWAEAKNEENTSMKKDSLYKNFLRIIQGTKNSILHAPIIRLDYQAVYHNKNINIHPSSIRAAAQKSSATAACLRLGPAPIQAAW
jgi:hypothetical protein